MTSYLGPDKPEEMGHSWIHQVQYIYGVTENSKRHSMCVVLTKFGLYRLEENSSNGFFQVVLLKPTDFDL